MSDLGNAFAGAAAGLGGYLVQQAQTEYAAALRQAELDAREQIDVRSDTRQHGYRMDEQKASAQAQQDNTRLSSNLAGGREAASDKRSRGLLQDTYQGDDGKMYGITKSGDTFELKGKKAAQSRGISTQDNQLLERLTTSNTGTDNSGNKVVDRQSMFDDLTRIGRSDLAKMYQPKVEAQKPGFWERNFGGGGQAAPDMATRAQGSSTPAGGSYDPDGSIAAARAAIKQGKDRNAVIQRLRDNGITPPPDL